MWPQWFRYNQTPFLTKFHYWHVSSLTCFSDIDEGSDSDEEWSKTRLYFQTEEENNPEEGKSKRIMFVVDAKLEELISISSTIYFYIISPYCWTDLRSVFHLTRWVLIKIMLELKTSAPNLILHFSHSSRILLLIHL